MSATRQRKSTEIRRREIADAALRVIGEQGATSLTAATIAAEVGVTSGALFRHFASLEEILTEAVARAVEAAEATFPAAADAPLDRLLTLAGARIELLSRRRGLAWLLLSDQVYLTVPEPAIRRLRKLVRRSKRFLLDALREGAADGSIRSDIRPEVLLVIFTGAVHATIGRANVHRGRAPSPRRVLGALRKLLTSPRKEKR